MEEDEMFVVALMNWGMGQCEPPATARRRRPGDTVAFPAPVGIAMGDMGCAYVHEDTEMPDRPIERSIQKNRP